MPQTLILQALKAIFMHRISKPNDKMIEDTEKETDKQTRKMFIGLIDDINKHNEFN